MRVALIVIANLIIRLVMPWSKVMGNPVRFMDNDGYFHAALIKQLVTEFPRIGVNVVLYSQYSGNVHGYQFYDWLVAAAIKALPFVNPDAVMAMAPIVISLLAIIPVYAIGRMLFNPAVGMIGAALFVIIPGEYMGRSLLGSVDHHAFEVLAIATVMSLIMYSIKVRGRYKLPVMVAALMAYLAYYFSWRGAALFLVVIGCAVATWGVYLLYKKYKHGGIATAIIGIGLGIYVAIQMLPLIIGTTSFATTAEAIPSFLPPLQPLLIVKIMLACLMLGVMIKRLWHAPQFVLYLFVVWSAVIIFGTIIQRRFDYYLTINLAIMGAYGIYHLVTGFKHYKQRAVMAVCMFLVVIITCVPAAVSIGRSAYFMPSRDWVSALQWLKTNSAYRPYQGILSWWDHGYWIIYIAERPPVCNPGQNPPDIERAARMLLHGSYSQFISENITHVILDSATVNGQLVTMAGWIGEEYDGNGLAQRLYNGEVEGFDLVYDSDVKIWEVK